MTEAFLRDIIFVATAAFFGGFLARTMKLPPIVGYIGSGILFGLFGRNFLSSYQVLLELSQLGIALLLFTHGFEITIDAFKKIDKKVFVLGFFQVCLTAFVIFPILLFFGLPVPVSILFSLLFSFSSTTVIIKLLEEKGDLHNFPGNVIFILLLVQDIFVVPVIILFPLLFGDKGGDTGNIVIPFLTSLVKPVVIFILILIFSKFFLSKVLKVIFRYPSHELTILATIFTAALTIGLFKYAGLPDAIAAFLAGVIISEQGKNLTPLTEIRPLRDLFLVIFFVLTGMLFSVPFFISHLGLILLLTAIIVIVKFLIMFCLLRVGLYKLKPSFTIASYLVNIGEFAIVIGQLALLEYYISFDSYYLLLSVFILSLICIPFENTFFEKLYQKTKVHKKFMKVFSDPKSQENSKDEQKIHNHVIICGHGRVGNEVRNLLELANIPYVVVDFNRNAISDLQTMGKRAFSGDSTDSEILDLAHIKTAKVLVIAFSDAEGTRKIVDIAQKVNKDIIIISRIHADQDGEDLVKKGVKEVIFPEYEAGIQMGLSLFPYFHISKSKKEEYLARLKHKKRT